LYVSIINYGNNYNGISQAANGYFGVNVQDLTDAQCTILAGIPQQPSVYELTSPEKISAAKERQRLVLQAMMDMKYLNQAQVNEIYNEPIF
ncbi:MAG: transglycosylase domain-containing protein, partial [Erysipelotrichaceae bacterium]|nr:transglycosylase domain-containing protein [Erysipelotrichaceae bacterium]